MTDATTSLLLDAIQDAKATSVSSCTRIERRMDEGFTSVHGRVNTIAEGLAVITAEHNRLAPLHRARRSPVDGVSEVPGPTAGLPTGRDWRGFARVAGWAVAGIAGTGLGALIMKILEAPK